MSKIYFWGLFSSILLIFGDVFATKNPFAEKWLPVVNDTVNELIWTPFRVEGNYLAVYDGATYQPFFIKGVNIGATIPGSWPGQLAITAEQYARWFRMIVDAGFNTIRIYTVHFPRFYEEFARYNCENPDKPLYLLQGVWLSEEYPIGYAINDLYSLTAMFDKAIHNAVDCIHGNNDIPQEPYAAYGLYTVNVSRWTLGYIIGREVLPNEVSATNYARPEVSEYKGTHLSIQQTKPSEVWVTRQLDKLIAYEHNNYHTTRPIAFSNWSLLDPLKQSTLISGNFGRNQFLNLNRIVLENAPGGLFISYHASPYYPSFIDNHPKYIDTSDAMGPNPFVAYLRDLKDHYRYPVLISETGVPTSYITACFSKSGMNHGGMTEKEQGISTVRLFRNIYDTDCGGVVLFSWMDEWYKPTWITNPTSSERRPLWHNVCSPENNFGLIRFDSHPDYFDKKQTDTFNLGRVTCVEISHNYAFLNMEVTLKKALGDGDTLWIAIDTYLRNVGESMIPGGRKLPDDGRAEFLLRITPDSANLYVTEAYSLQGIHTRTSLSKPFRTTVTDGAPWRLERWHTDDPDVMQDIGKLRVCKGDDVPCRHHSVHIRNDGISIRLPWSLLYFSDPSNSQVIHDDNDNNHHKNNNDLHLNSIRSDGITATLICDEISVRTGVYVWSKWEVNEEGILDENSYIETEKASLPMIRDELKNNTFTPK